MCLSCIAAAAQQQFGAAEPAGGAVMGCPLAMGGRKETIAQATVRRVAERDRVADAACKQAAFERYGVIPRNYLGYMDSPREAVLAELVHSLANDKVSPELLFTVAMREGLNEYFNSGGRRAERGELPVDGFAQVGTDDFGGNANRLITGGYLRPSFQKGVDFAPYQTVNGENNQLVRTARFTSLKPALEAVAAELTSRRDQMTRDYIAAHSIDEEAELTAAQRDYLNYIYYNATPDSRQLAIRNTRPGVIPRWTGNPRGAGAKGREGYSKNVHSNALVTLSTVQYLRCIGVFSEAMPRPAPWRQPCPLDANEVD